MASFIANSKLILGGGVGVFGVGGRRFPLLVGSMRGLCANIVDQALLWVMCGCVGVGVWVCGVCVWVHIELYFCTAVLPSTG